MSARLAHFLASPDVDLQRTSIGDTEIEVIAHLQPINHHTLTLNFSNNQITHIGIMQLSTVQWHALTRLVLCYIGNNAESNGIGNKGCLYISRCTLPHLRELNLNDCSIEDAGMIHLAKGAFVSLQKIKLQRNDKIGEGVSWLSKGQWPRLRVINLWTNSLKPCLMVRLSVYLTFPEKAYLYLDYYGLSRWNEHRTVREIYQQRELRYQIG